MECLPLFCIGILSVIASKSPADWSKEILTLLPGIAIIVDAGCPLLIGSLTVRVNAGWYAYSAATLSILPFMLRELVRLTANARIAIIISSYSGVYLLLQLVCSNFDMTHYKKTI